MVAPLLWAWSVAEHHGGKVWWRNSSPFVEARKQRGRKRPGTRYTFPGPAPSDLLLPSRPTTYSFCHLSIATGSIINLLMDESIGIRVLMFHSLSEVSPLDIAAPGTQPPTRETRDISNPNHNTDRCGNDHLQNLEPLLLISLAAFASKKFSPCDLIKLKDKGIFHIECPRDAKNWAERFKCITPGSGNSPLLVLGKFVKDFELEKKSYYWVLALVQPAKLSDSAGAYVLHCFWTILQF